jgi:hypothetical protein
VSQFDLARQDHAPATGTVTPMAATATPQKIRAERRALIQLGALLCAAIVALIGLWLVQRGGGHEAAVPPANGKPTLVSRAQLEKLAASVDHPVYWAGAKDGAYELTRMPDGRIYVRYLPSAEKVGDRSPKYLTVGTYPTKTAFLALRRAAARKGAISLKMDDRGLLVFNTSAPKSVYFGYPDAKYQVEVFDPSPQQARALALSGEIVPIR